jgi:FdhE protein
MDFTSIDKAIDSYSSLLADDDRARLEFFRGLWQLQQRIRQGAPVGQLPDSDTLETWYWQERPLLMMMPLAIDAELLADAAQQVSAYLAEHAGLTEQAARQLAAFDWQAFLAGQGTEQGAEQAVGQATGRAVGWDVRQAGYDPSAFIEACCQALRSGAASAAAVDAAAVDAVLPEPADGSATVPSAELAELVAMVLAMTLRPLLEPTAAAAMGSLDLKQASAEHKKPLRCPVCGSLAAAGCVGEVPSGAKNGRLLYCATCGANWEFERIRCARCGSQNQEKLHYFHLDGDSAHRLQLCDACGDYLRVIFRVELPAVFVFEVEDVVMARLDKVAQDVGRKGGRGKEG